MIFFENLREAWQSVRDNALRSVLTASIIAIGISALVGILTAIDGLKQSITDGLASLGSNLFRIQDVRTGQKNVSGKKIKQKKAITFAEAAAFQARFQMGNAVSIYAYVSQSATLKRLSEATNPNAVVNGVDGLYLAIKGYRLKSGRNFSKTELAQGANVAILGTDIVKQLFKQDKTDVLGKYVVFRGKKFRIIGLLEAGKGLEQGSTDRSMCIPLENANKFRAQQRLSYVIMTALSDPTQMEYALGEATGLMRQIRKDTHTQPHSFSIKKSDSLSAQLDKISGTLRIGGGLIAFITLLGASIALMNIMMVSVTERTKEIGIRKALGANPAQIQAQFLAEAVSICIFGGLAGIFIGLLLGNLVAIFIGKGAFVVPWLWIFLGLLSCLLVGIAAGFYPAKKASNMDPIVCLRRA